VAASGITGPQGPAGEQGSPGVSLYEYVSLSTPTPSLIPGETFSATDALCPAGKKVMGGGCYGSTSLAVIETAPLIAGNGGIVGIVMFLGQMLAPSLLLG
jgi:hypothetical protein